MTVPRYFATPIYAAPLQRASVLQRFNTRLLRECMQLRADDAAGRQWSRLNYVGGFTSYGSVHRLHRLSPLFARLQHWVNPHVRRFARELDFDLRGRALEMTDCWVNVMGRAGAHGLHLHPLSTISGTYYVRTPANSPGLKFEDPRLERMMAAPPRRGAARRANRNWITLPARAGHLVLFESWLRHEVAAHQGTSERVSVSFNYAWF